MSVQVHPMKGANRYVYIHCPRCIGRICTHSDEGVTMEVSGTFFGDDADMIPGTANLLSSPVLAQPYACSAMATVGRCPHCLSKYWYLDVYLSTGDQDSIIDMLSSDPKWTDCYVADRDSGLRTWITYCMSIPSGPAYHHMIGPFVVPEPVRVTGPNGVSACAGGVFWEQARNCFFAVQADLINVQRHIEISQAV